MIAAVCETSSVTLFKHLFLFPLVFSMMAECFLPGFAADLHSRCYNPHALVLRPVEINMIFCVVFS